MACYHPLVAYRSKDVNVTGKRSMVFNPAQAYEPDNPVKLPCGQCIGCRLKYSAQWAARCYHESQMHSSNCFLTLTFDPKFLPKDGSVRVRDCQLFMKRFRKRFSSIPIRMAYCGEYGEKNGRPHYHFIIFGFDFSDRYAWQKNQQTGHTYYRSPILEELWPFGNSLIGDVSFESAAYVARYMLKKQKGPDSWLKYAEVDLLTGEILVERSKEFFQTSRKPGIGKTWFEKFHGDVYPKDFFVVDGRKISPPKYYDSQFEILDPYTMDDIKEKRIRCMKSAKVASENTYERLTVREKVKLAQISTLTRSYESGS